MSIIISHNNNCIMQHFATIKLFRVCATVLHTNNYYALPSPRYRNLDFESLRCQPLLSLDRDEFLIENVLVFAHGAVADHRTERVDDDPERHQ